MTDDDKKFSKQIIGKTVVSKSGKRFGEVGDIIFETRSGELIHLVLNNPTQYATKLELEKDKDRIWDILDDGRKKAQKIAQKTMAEIKEVIF